MFLKIKILNKWSSECLTRWKHNMESKKKEAVQCFFKALPHLDGVSQCRADRLHQRFLCQELKDGRLLLPSGGGQMGSGLCHGCCTTTTQAHEWTHSEIPGRNGWLDFCFSYVLQFYSSHNGIRVSPHCITSLAAHWAESVGLYINAAISLRLAPAGPSVKKKKRHLPPS